MAGDINKEFQILWGQTAGKVRAYMFCACENWQDADDLAQDCYLRAFRGWGQFNGNASRQAWLFGIARRTRVDWFRKKRREEPTVGSDKLGEIRLVASEKTDDESIEKVWEAIKDLKTEHSQVLHLRFAAGLSYAEMAQALDVPIGTVRSRLHRALKGVRKQIQEREHET